MRPPHLLPLVLLLVAASSARAGKRPPRGPLDPGAHRVTVNGERLVYHVAGKGPTLVAFPGGPGLDWRYLRMPAVEKTLTVVYVEPLGTGASARSHDSKDYSRDRDVADLEALRAELGLESFYLLGHSYGGRVALDYALAHGEHLRGLVLYDTAPMSGPDWRTDVDANMGRYRDRPWFKAAWAACGSQGKARSDEQLTAAFRGCAPFYFHRYERRQDALDAYLSSKVFMSLGRAQRGTSIPHDVRDRLGQIRTPTLVVVGATDFVCSPKMAALLDAGIPDSELVTLKRSGHFGHVEEPRAFAGAIQAFVDRVEASAAPASQPVKASIGDPPH